MGDLHYIDDNSVEKIVVNQSDVDDTPVDGVTIAPISSNWAYDHENDDDVHTATQVNVSELGTATYDDVQDYINFFGDRTLLSGGTISDNGDGTAAVASLTGWVKVSDSPTAVGKFFDFAGGNTATLVDLTTNYVFLDYNGGTPQLVTTTTFLSLALKLDHIEIGTIYRQGTTLHFHQHHNIGIDRANVIDIHHQEENPPHRASGLVTSDNGSLTLDITAGVIYEGIDREATVPFNTPNSGTADDTEANKLHDADGGFAITDVGKTVHNTTDDTYANVTAFVDSGELTLDADIFISGENYDLDVWTACYTPDNGSTWTLVKGQTTIDNNNYNNVASGLVALTANRYAVHWVFIDLDGNHLNVVYGQGDYTASQAIDAGVPALMPDLVVHYSAFIAKIIVRKGQTDLVIAYPWTSAFSTSLATDHGNLAGLSDDDHTHYLLVAGTRALAGAWDMGSQALTNVNFDGGTIDGATITSPTINGTIATTGLTLPAVTLSGDLDADNYDLTNLENLLGDASKNLVVRSTGSQKILYLDGGKTAANTGNAILIRTYNADDAFSSRLIITGGVNECTAAWGSVIHTGIKLGAALNANGQDITSPGTVDGIDIAGLDAAVVKIADLENPPTEDEAGKAATSEWSFDHDAAATGVHGVGGDTVCSEGTALAFAIAL